MWAALLGRCRRLRNFNTPATASQVEGDGESVASAARSATTQGEFLFHLSQMQHPPIANGTRILVPFATGGCCICNKWQEFMFHLSQFLQNGGSAKTDSRRGKLSWTAPLQGCKFARGEGRDKEEKRETREKRENRPKKHNKRDSPTFLRLWLP
jgi:hypothetical protein